MNDANEKILFLQNINVRIDDINYGNHLCHTKFINLLHNARALFLKEHNLSELDCFGFGMVMSALEIKYKSPCLFDDVLEIAIFSGKFEKVAFELSYTVQNKTTNKLAANAKTTMCFISKDKQALVKPPAEFQALIESLNFGK